MAITFTCLTSFMPEMFGTAIMIVAVIVSVAGSLWAAVALICRKPHAIRITGWLLRGFAAS